MQLSQRKSFRKEYWPKSFRFPNLIEVQTNSYQWFIHEGLRELLEELFPIKDSSDRGLMLKFVDYYFDEPKFNEVESKNRNATYEAPLRIKVSLEDSKGLKREQEVYLGDFPLMTDRGTFIINGIERVVISQIVRSSGVFFSYNLFKDKKYYNAKVIPNRGAWIEMETDFNDVIWVKIDRKRKVAATSLLRAFGYGSDDELIGLFADAEEESAIKYIENTIAKDAAKDMDEGLREVYKRIRPGDLASADNAKGLIYAMFFNFDRYDFGKVGRYKLSQRFGGSLQSKDINAKENRILKREDVINIIKEIIEFNISQEEADDIDHLGNRRIRAVGELIQNKFRVGLTRMERIARDRMSTLDLENMTASKLINARPVIGVVREFFMSSPLSQFMDQTNPLSELEHKRRISALGPGGVSRERAGFDVRDVHTTHYGRICPIATPEGPNIGLVGHLSSYARVNEYGFIEAPYRVVKHDIENKSNLTEGEILREDIKELKLKAGDKITKEISKKLENLSDKIKIIPVKPRVTDEVVFVDAFEEEKYVSTAATTPIEEDGYFKVEKAEVRYHGQPVISKVEKIDFMDVAPNQIVSVATSLIPFLEHDDAVRALMGTNMQRQAVPCILPEAPIVGTGMEAQAARDTGHVIISKTDGKVVEVDACRIQVLSNDGKVETYYLNKFVRSNISTCINQHPLVYKGDKVKKGDILSDGAAVDNGELALGQNVLVAFMPFEGSNYEDAIIISERLVERDYYTSIYIEDYMIDVRDTKLGPEIVTSDIPNIGEEKLKDLDEEGIVRIGANVSSGDILVGKITPKGETELSAEEKLLRAIFGEKARDVRDTSMYLEHGEHGKVIGIKIFSRDEGDKLSAGIIKSIQVTIANLRKVQVGDKMAGRHGNKGVISRIVPVSDMPFTEDGCPVDIILSPLGVVSRMNLGQILETHLGLAAQKLGYNVKTSVLNGVPEERIKEELIKAGFSEDGKMQLFDGKTGVPFDQKTTVGQIYMMKLNHMVEDKIHQRSIGPYSLITQQPLGGKAQFGGQRFGEMEVWALEAYGAAHTLQEILTIKSDDVQGRSKAYEAIIKGEKIENLNMPESFNVLIRELKGLGIDVELVGGKSLKEANEARMVKKDEDGKEGKEVEEKKKLETGN
ncbi:MAG: DNA-directed RNA polymerase subunit beta [bacterium]